MENIKSTIRVRKWREKNKLKYSYYNLKHNAKRRNIIFLLSYKEFCEFAFKCTLFLQRGIKRESYHIDRIDESKGYEIGNLQMLTNIENITKYQGIRKYFKTHSILEPINDDS